MTKFEKDFKEAVSIFKDYMLHNNVEIQTKKDIKTAIDCLVLNDKGERVGVIVSKRKFDIYQYSQAIIEVNKINKAKEEAKKHNIDKVLVFYIYNDGFAYLWNIDRASNDIFPISAYKTTSESSNRIMKEFKSLDIDFDRIINLNTSK